MTTQPSITLTEHAIIPIDEAGAHVAAINAKYKGVVFDCNDKQGMADARAARIEIREARFAIEKARASRVTELTAASKATSTRAAELTAPLREVEDPIHDMIVTVEDRLLAEKTERERIASERAQAQQAIVRSIEELPGKLMGASVAELQAGLDQLAAIKIDELDDLFKTAATIAIEEVGERLTRAIGERAELDRQAAELLERQRQIDEQQRSQQAALDAQRKEFEAQQAAQQAKIDEDNRLRQIELDRQAAELREVRERQQREDQERQARELAEQQDRERIEAERAEAARIEAEAARIREEERAIKNATQLEALSEGYGLLVALGHGDHLTARKMLAVIERSARNK